MRFSYKGQKNNPAKSLVFSALVFVVIVVIFLVCIFSVNKNSAKRQKELLNDALMNDITFCYAAEGKYPESLEYLKENYGLTYDEEKFYVDYKTYGSNIRPEVMIIERK